MDSYFSIEHQNKGFYDIQIKTIAVSLSGPSNLASEIDIFCKRHDDTQSSPKLYSTEEAVVIVMDSDGGETDHTYDSDDELCSKATLKRKLLLDDTKPFKLDEMCSDNLCQDNVGDSGDNMCSNLDGNADITVCQSHLLDTDTSSPLSGNLENIVPIVPFKKPSIKQFNNLVAEMPSCTDRHYWSPKVAIQRIKPEPLKEKYGNSHDYTESPDWKQKKLRRRHPQKVR